MLVSSRRNIDPGHAPGTQISDGPHVCMDTISPISQIEKIGQGGSGAKDVIDGNDDW